jgi:hypothetical protein
MLTRLTHHDRFPVIYFIFNFPFNFVSFSQTAASPLLNNHQSINMDGKSAVADESGGSDDDEEEEEEEDQQWDLTDTQLKIKGFGLLLIATAIASVFSDPMVDVISAFGQKVNIDAFYISFVITPVASNASEVIAGLIFATKRTNESISLCHSSLLGGASMNATMCLAVFMYAAAASMQSHSAFFFFVFFFPLGFSLTFCFAYFVLLTSQGSDLLPRSDLVVLSRSDHPVPRHHDRCAQLRPDSHHQAVAGSDRRQSVPTRCAHDLLDEELWRTRLN